ncbi:MAG: protein phosphatase CheZ [Noviherbaspirillum sp.]
MEAARSALTAGDAAQDQEQAQEALLARVGQMTRSLHDSLRGLDFDKLAERAAHDIPDARDRLEYVARMTEQAAQKVLNATEAASPLQDRIAGGARTLAQQWRETLADAATPEPDRALAARTLAYLEQTSEDSELSRQHLMNIMMAQDFQDLTGQVIRKVTELAHGLEQQLVQLLVDYAPGDAKREANTGLLNGPQINPGASADVVANQSQVDDLLESLGF